MDPRDRLKQVIESYNRLQKGAKELGKQKGGGKEERKEEKGKA